MKIGILGTGNFALAMGYLLEINNILFTFIGRDKTQLDELEKYGTNKKYTNYTFQNTIKTEYIPNDIPNDFSNYNILLFCLPSSAINMINNINKNVFIIFTCKGFNKQFIFERFNNYSILSGGSYSTEILEGIPCYITLASKNLEQNIIIKNLLESQNCIISLNNAPESIELLGIFKNILAVFCGIINKLNMGKNIESAFLSIVLKNLKNMIDFNNNTLIEPAGIGDIFLSCSSVKSRNYSFGMNLILTRNDRYKKTIEGYSSLCNLNDHINNDLINNMMQIINKIKSDVPLSEIKISILEIIYKY
jgi:glycerol-3-phosphate dehydrogenase (NAD(P)+)